MVRAWALARMQATGQDLAGDDTTPLAVAGAVLLWLLRLSLAPASTLTGFRRWVIEECPVAPGRTAPNTPPPVPPQAPPASEAPTPPQRRRRADGKPGKQDLLIALASQRHDLRTVQRIAASCRIGCRATCAKTRQPRGHRVAGRGRGSRSWSLV